MSFVKKQNDENVDIKNWLRKININLKLFVTNVLSKKITVPRIIKSEDNTMVSV